jgi:hypothetical protein
MVRGRCVAPADRSAPTNPPLPLVLASAVRPGVQAHSVTVRCHRHRVVTLLGSQAQAVNADKHFPIYLTQIIYLSQLLSDDFLGLTESLRLLASAKLSVHILHINFQTCIFHIYCISFTFCCMLSHINTQAECLDIV